MIKIKRIILHSDLNNFYASVECAMNPELRDKFVAVCGNREDRHGIVLAKNQAAKLMGVKTGEAIWEATQKCPELVIVPPHFEEYMKYSKAVKSIYNDYTDLVEPFGMDECWLDVTGSEKLFGSGVRIANIIRNRVKREVGLTVSVGVSYNKIFAKLGSDLKKPDAVTLIKDKDEIRDLPASDLLGVGRATFRKMKNYCIKTIGDIADADVSYMKKWFGKNGEMLWLFANGLDESRVLPFDYVIPAKSIGHGITTTSDLNKNDEVWRVMLELSIDISRKLRLSKTAASGVSVYIRDNKLCTVSFMTGLESPTHNTMTIATTAFELFKKKYFWANPIRSVTVQAIKLVGEDEAAQISFFDKFDRKGELIENAMEKIRERYGRRSITYASLLMDLKMPAHRDAEIIMPSFHR